MRFAAEFENSFDRYLNPQLVCGLRLSFDPLWIAVVRRWAGPYFGYPSAWWDIFDGIRPFDWFERISKQHEWAFDGWRRLRKSQGQSTGAMPIQFRIYYRSDEARRGSGEIPPTFLQFQVVADVRPPAIAIAISLNPRDQVGQQSPATNGTLGGFLRDPNTGSDYAITCSHVCGTKGNSLYHPGPAKTKHHSVIGTVIHSVLPGLNSGARCGYAVWPSPNTLDLSASAVATAVSVSNHFPVLGKPVLISPINSIMKADPVMIYGERSGRIDAEIAMYSIYDEIDVGGTRCFSDIFTLTYPRPYYLNADIIKAGDSGGWVLADRQGITAWDGMVFASDGATAYACYAENIINELRTVCPGVILPP